jgi:hypothetical protein
MTQSTSQIGADQSGLAYRNADNAGKQAILNHHKGNPAPAYAEAGMIWLDDAATPWLLKFYDGADWIVLGEVNATANTFNPYTGVAMGRLLNYAADTGTANVYAVAPSPPITAYAAGQVVTLKPGNANTGAATLNVNGLGAKNIKLLDGTNPAANTLLTTGSYILMYDGTNFIIMNPSQPVFSGDSGSGGVKGLVPAPAAGDAAANKVLGAGGGWISAASAVTVNAQAGNYTLQASDKSCIISLTGSSAATFSFTAPATLGSGWFCYLYNNSTASLTVNPGSSVQIDGLTSYIMYPGEVRLSQCSGTAFTTILLNGGTATFNTSGTWVRPPGYMGFDIEIISGGASGGSRLTTGNAGGGAGGALYHLRVNASSLIAIGSSETVSVGAVASGVSGNAAGVAGNSSSFTINGVALTVNGGAGGATSAANSAVSPASTGAPTYFITGATFFGQGGGVWYAGITSGASASNIPLLNAGLGGDVSASNVPGVGGNSVNGGGGGGSSSSASGGTRSGGTSILGGAGGAGGAHTGGNGTNGTAPGGGGGAAVQGGTSGAGAPGRVIIRGLI